MSEQDVAQVSLMLGCSAKVAQDLLVRHDGNMERAINSFFEDQDRGSSTAAASAPADSWPASFSDPHAEWSKPVGSGAGDSAAIGGQPARPSQSVAFHPGYNDPPAYSQGRVSSPRNNPIDLTDDSANDDDLQRAMAASLQESQGSQANASGQALIGPLPADSQPEPKAAGRRSRVAGHVRKRKEPSDLSFLLEETPETRASSPAAEDADSSSTRRKYGLRNRESLARPNLGVAAPATLQLRAGERMSAAPRRRHAGSKGYGRRNARRSRASTARSFDDLDDDLTLSEDEQLRQALEASVQSLNGGPGQETSGSRTPILPPHLELSEHSQRKEGAPVALVPPMSTVDVVAALLQAVYAAVPARHAFLSLALPDERVSNLANYWKGARPTSEAGTPLFDSVDPRLKASADLCRRIQTLFAFMNETERAVCVATDVTSLTPNQLYLNAVDRQRPGAIATQYFEYLLKGFEEAAEASAALVTSSPERMPSGLDVGQLQKDLVLGMTGVFQSWGTVAYASPPAPAAGVYVNGIPRPSTPPVPRSHLMLTHDAVNSDVFSCLRHALANDDEGALITEPGAVLSLCVEHREGGTPLPPLVLEETLYLDPFLWSRRRGIRIESETNSSEIRAAYASLRELEQRLQKLTGVGGKQPSTLLQDAADYFERLAKADQNSMRGQLQGDVAPHLRRILAKVEQERRDAAVLIKKLQARIDLKRLEGRRKAQEEASNPAWQTVAYELCSVLVHESHRILAYVKQGDGRWWRVCDGVATEVAAAEATSDKLRDVNSFGVFWVCYQRREDGRLPDEPGPVATKMAVQDDNLTLQSVLLSLARSDATTPVADDASKPPASTMTTTA